MMPLSLAGPAAIVGRQGGQAMANPFRKGDRVEVTSGKETHHGVVQRIEAENVVVRLDSGKLCKPFPARHFRPSTKPLPEGDVHREWAKGDRVEFKVAVPVDDGPRARKETKLLHGTVLSVAKAAKVMVDGGQHEFTVPLGLLAPSTKALPAPVPDAMDDWGVTSYKEMRSLSEETTAFSAKVTFRGKVVMLASNHGTGGCNRYDALPGAPPRIAATFAAAAKDWFARHGAPVVTEAEDLFLTWHTVRRPYAVTAKEFVREYDEMLEEVGQMALSVERGAAWNDARQDEGDAPRGPGM